MAVLTAWILNIKTRYIKKGIKKCRLIKGRLEKIKNNIFIDFAHTPQAMEGVLLYFKKTFPNKKIKVLFGCGGNRDKLKRKEMGKIASKIADSIIVTSDNSRNENPLEIVEDIKEGITKDIDYCVILDRKEAIYYAVNRLKKNEILLLLGKGHENYEIIGDKKTFFSEKEMIIEALKNGKNT
jgi:UDP-N-acetylmuramyl tripeptide synthase